MAASHNLPEPTTAIPSTHIASYTLTGQTAIECLSVFAPPTGPALLRVSGNARLGEGEYSCSRCGYNRRSVFVKSGALRCITVNCKCVQRPLSPLAHTSSATKTARKAESEAVAGEADEKSDGIETEGCETRGKKRRTNEPNADEGFEQLHEATDEAPATVAAGAPPVLVNIPAAFFSILSKIQNKNTDEKYPSMANDLADALAVRPSEMEVLFILQAVLVEAKQPDLIHKFMLFQLAHSKLVAEWLLKNFYAEIAEDWQRVQDNPNLTNRTLADWKLDLLKAAPTR